MPNTATRANTPALQAVVPGVWGLRNVFVNLYFVRDTSSPLEPWVLVDAGLPGSAPKIRQHVEAIFGPNNPPAAIILTHGHFDHVGALKTLAEEWNVPVYAHPLELPYLTGRSSYPPPDPTVGGGAMAAMSFLYPKKPIDLGSRVQPLPINGTVPFLSEWRWIPTPGHTAGHVSFFREYDRTLIAGDAFVTVQQESGTAVWEQRQEVHGPPAYFTQNWAQSRASVEKLAALEPQIAATGHGIPMHGEELRRQLHDLSLHFEQQTVPKQGRYVSQPVVADETGTVSVPPATEAPLPKWIIGAALLGGLGYLLLRDKNKARRGYSEHHDEYARRHRDSYEF
ncbi:MBL fold metallo-hydrolase [Hymenobacter chitinivorans]|uniref:Glyoxylase-like metal-dependent hydrolase (Beta-lactamase superfamily II) n=1 Tax=Hymenobacter chitinivorans DSM 11115 TaxID=1121954 RepID=A0A2M9AQZ9_9BACT|nr:MBL fold metallo-hydrolase [Hymenobacter chitinivorans]PJJ48127.1 glyoxylase-like metal-dependent hydrolase (beta-lactamase superfamily II) [Hymenobacter chitinivorans DSM 11115]